MWKYGIFDRWQTDQNGGCRFSDQLMEKKQTSSGYELRGIGRNLSRRGGGRFKCSFIKWFFLH